MTQLIASAVLLVSCVIVPPSKPIGPLVLGAVTKDSVVLSWNPPDDLGGGNLTGYIIEAKDVLDIEVSKMYTRISADQNTTTLSGLKTRHIYQFRVYAENESGKGDGLVNKKTVRVQDIARKPSPPGKPVIIVDEESFGDVIVSWQEPETDGGCRISTYIVERYDLISDAWTRVNPGQVMNTKFRVSKLAASLEYSFRVSAENDIGVGLPSKESEPVVLTLRKPRNQVPVFTKGIADCSAVVSSKAVFSCEFTGKPPPEISWYKNGFEIYEGRKIKIITLSSDSSLFISEVRIEDAGTVKCQASNKAGSASTSATLIIRAPPEIKVPPRYFEGLTYDRGETIKLKLNILGRPVPELTWLRNKKPLGMDEKTTILIDDDVVHLKILNVDNIDSGEYKITAKNELGEDSIVLNITVADIPGPPTGRPISLGVDWKSCKLYWKPPSDDGGSPITSYIVEKLREDLGVWCKAITTHTTSATVYDLFDGVNYRFRVKAVNIYGPSEASEESESIWVPEIRSEASSLTSKQPVGAGLKIEDDSSLSEVPAISEDVEEGDLLESIAEESLAVDQDDVLLPILDVILPSEVVISGLSVFDLVPTYAVEKDLLESGEEIALPTETNVPTVCAILPTEIEIPRPRMLDLVAVGVHESDLLETSVDTALPTEKTVPTVCVILPTEIEIPRPRMLDLVAVGVPESDLLESNADAALPTKTIDQTIDVISPTGEPGLSELLTEPTVLKDLEESIEIHEKLFAISGPIGNVKTLDTTEKTKAEEFVSLEGNLLETFHSCSSSFDEYFDAETYRYPLEELSLGTNLYTPVFEELFVSTEIPARSWTNEATCEYNTSLHVLNNESEETMTNTESVFKPKIEEAIVSTDVPNKLNSLHSYLNIVLESVLPILPLQTQGDKCTVANSDIITKEVVVTNQTYGFFATEDKLFEHVSDTSTCEVVITENHSLIKSRSILLRNYGDQNEYLQFSFAPFSFDIINIIDDFKPTRETNSTNLSHCFLTISCFEIPSWERGQEFQSSPWEYEKAETIFNPVLSITNEVILSLETCVAQTGNKFERIRLSYEILPRDFSLYQIWETVCYFIEDTSVSTSVSVLESTDDDFAGVEAVSGYQIVTPVILELTGEFDDEDENFDPVDYLLRDLITEDLVQEQEVDVIASNQELVVKSETDMGKQSVESLLSLAEELEKKFECKTTEIQRLETSLSREMHSLEKDLELLHSIHELIRDEERDARPETEAESSNVSRLVEESNSLSRSLLTTRYTSERRRERPLSPISTAGSSRALTRREWFKIPRLSDEMSSSSDEPEQDFPDERHLPTRTLWSAPRVVMQLENRIIPAGYRIKMACCIIGEPEPEIKWIRNGKPLKDKLRQICISMFDFGLCSVELYNCKPSDTGEYTCEATNPYGSVSTKGYLRVTGNKEESPEEAAFERCPADTTLDIGQKLDLVWIATGVPLPSVRWLKDSKPLCSSLHVDLYSDHRGLCRLAILRCKLSDSGAYTCIIENDCGGTSSTVMVVVNDDDDDKPSSPLPDLLLDISPTLHSKSFPEKKQTVGKEALPAPVQDYSK